MIKKLLSVNLKLNTGTYKLMSVTRNENDGSFYFNYASNNYLKQIGASQTIPIKCTYHPTGLKSRLTAGPYEKRFGELPTKTTRPINLITDIEGLYTFSLNDIQDNIEKMLDPIGSNKYKDNLTIDGSKYKHLTIKFFLANKTFTIDYGKVHYGEIYRYSYDNIDLIVTLENSWPE